MKYVYESAFATEISRYLRLLSEKGRYIDKIQSSLRSLDSYLVNNGSVQKILHSEIITAWIKTRNVSSRTKAMNISHTNGFVKYLVSLGIEANCPEILKARSEYVPYIFSDEELNRIISAADNFEATAYSIRSALIFPVLLRLLYVCGLRLGEACNLRWKHVDLERSVLTIKNAKNQKQRFVPMDGSMSILLKKYKAMTQINEMCEEYLFESDRNPNKPFDKSTFHGWFKKVLGAANIHYAKAHLHERGPCPHCFRHLFTLKSFLKSESEGRRFEDTSHFLAAYLGHDSPKELETYLSSNHSVYTQSHQRVNTALGAMFPEVSFDED